MTSRTIIAVGTSLLIHALLAFGLIAYLEYAPEPDVLATLDLSSVELSFAEEVEDTQPVAPRSSTAGKLRPPKPKLDEKPPEAKLERPLPPEVGEVRFPEPRENARLKTKDVKEKDERRETEDVEKEVPSKDTRTVEQSEQSNSSPPVAPRQARIDAPPRPKRNIKPDYPKGARQRGEQGDVVLEIRVNAAGTVDDVKVAVSSGFAELDAAAVKAARVAKFSPARSGREPVASTARLKLQFKLK